MIDLYLHNYKVDSVFQLLGKHDNDISFSIGWAFALCRKENGLSSALPAGRLQPFSEFERLPYLEPSLPPRSMIPIILDYFFGVSNSAV